MQLQCFEYNKSCWTLGLHNTARIFFSNFLQHEKVRLGLGNPVVMKKSRFHSHDPISRGEERHKKVLLLPRRQPWRGCVLIFGLSFLPDYTVVDHNTISLFISINAHMELATEFVKCKDFLKIVTLLPPWNYKNKTVSKSNCLSPQ